MPGPSNIDILLKKLRAAGYPLPESEWSFKLLYPRDEDPSGFRWMLVSDSVQLAMDIGGKSPVQKTLTGKTQFIVNGQNRLEVIRASPPKKKEMEEPRVIKTAAPSSWSVHVKKRSRGTYAPPTRKS